MNPIPNVIKIKINYLYSQLRFPLMTWQSSLESIQGLHPVPPSPQLEQKILRTKRQFLTGESLPTKTTQDVLNLQSLVLITQRPARTRQHTLGPSPTSMPSPVIGERRALVLLVDFQDNPSSKPRQHYMDMLFSSKKYSTGSLRDYYYEASYHRLNVTGDVSGGESDGESGGESGWHRAPKPYSYYADEKYGFGEYPRNATKLVEDAVDLAAGQVNFADYDMDGDGEVDALFVVHAGPGAEVSGMTNQIWSHMSNIPPKTVDGVRVSRYSMEPEDGNIGVFCHELGHVFGLPDLYDYDMDSAGTGSWDLMAGGSWNNGGLTPSHPVGWCKATLGWVNPLPVSSSLKSVTLKPSILYPEIYRLPAGRNEKEYFLIENRRRAGFDSYIPGDGLMIQHIDENQRNNNDQAHYLVDIEQCDGRCDLNKNANRGDEGDLFPARSSNAFSVRTNPSSKTYGGEDSGVVLKNIRRSGENIVIDLLTGEVSKAVWHYDRKITMAFAHSRSQWSWAFISGLGWRRIKDDASGEDASVVGLCAQAVALDRKVNVYADGSFLYAINRTKV